MNKLSRRFIGNWAKLLPAKRKRQQNRRRLMAESLEDRRLLAVDMNFLHNYEFPRDVTGDGHVSPVDALVTINYINGSTGLGALGEDPVTVSTMKPDVNGDGFVSPADVLNIINAMADGEAGNVVTFSHQATDLDGNTITNVSVGQTFVLQTLVQDMRTSPQGVFAGYFDLDYDEGLVRVNMRESQTVQLSQIPNSQSSQRGNPTVSFKLSFNGNTTGSIELRRELSAFGQTFPADTANAQAIQDALLALPGLNVGDIEVVPFSGGTVNGVNFEVKFGGQFAGTDVPKMVASDVQLLPAASGTTVPTVTVFNTSDELLVPSLAELQADNPGTTAADRAALVARSEQTRSFTFAFPKYSSGQSGVFGVQPTNNMIIDELGAFTSNQSPGDGSQEVLVEVQVQAIAGGTATFLGNRADQSPDHDVLVFGVDTAVNIADIGFMPLNLTISADITAIDDGPFDFQEGSANNNINVLANDSIAVGSGPTITSPLGITSITGGQLTFVGSSISGPNYTFTPNAGFSGQTDFTYTISNGQGATATADVTINVQPATPVLNITGPTSRTTNEDTAFTLSGFSLTDPEVSPITVNLSANGTLSQTSFTGTLSEVTTALNSVTYTPLSNSTAADTINISASAGTLSDTHTVSVTITPVNDPSTINNLPNNLTVFPGTANSIPNFSVVDPDSPISVTLSVDQGTLSSTSFNGGQGTLNISGVTYTPPGGIQTGTATLTVQVGDGTSQTVTLNIVPPVMPFAVADTITINEGAASGSVDVLGNDVAKSARANLSITANTASSIPANQGSVSLNGSTFTYTPPNADFFTTTSITFTYTIEDTVDAGDGPSTGTVAITVNPVNDPPVISTAAFAPKTFAEDSNPTTITGLSVTDIDNSSVNVTLTVTNGVLNAGGQSGKSITVTNGSLGGLTYEPDDNYFGPDTLSISANDGSAPAVTDTVNLTITPVNDAPTLVVPGAQSFIADFDNRFTSTPNPFRIADIDAGSSNVQVDLTIGDGTLTIGSTTGVTVSQNPGGANGIRLTGSVTNINNALASGVDYNTSVDGNKSLNVVVNDLGNTGSGGSLTASATVAVEVLDFVPVDITGNVFIDLNNNNSKDSNESGIEGVNVTISGTDFQGNALVAPGNTSTTNANGTYAFLGLRPNLPGQPYTITQEQPAFVQGGGSNSFSLTIDQRGNVSVTGGSANFGEGGFVPEFADVFDHFLHLGDAPNDSGITIATQGGSQEWSTFYGSGWDMNRFSNARLAINSGGQSGVLTVFDSVLGQDRTVNVSTANATLTSRGTGSDRIYRVIGGSSLLGSVSSSSSSQGANPEAEAVSSQSIFLRAVDAIMAGA